MVPEQTWRKRTRTRTERRKREEVIFVCCKLEGRVTGLFDSLVKKEKVLLFGKENEKKTRIKLFPKKKLFTKHIL